MRTGLPVAGRGMRIGLLGGSFDPPHRGHVHITREALKRLGLDRVWWLVSPGNPLKVHQPARMAARIAEARRLLGGAPRVVVSDIEARLRTRCTADTIARLQALYPGVRFVWLMGADNMAQFHRWERWRDIVARVPVAVLARPGAGLAGLLSPAARIGARDRLARPDALARHPPPAWAYVSLPLDASSSSAIRAGGGWKGAGPQEGIPAPPGDMGTIFRL